MIRTRRIALVLMLSLLVIGAALWAGTVYAKTRLQGAGATFPAPFYKRLVVVYQGNHPDVLIDYQSIGSGGGIRAITDKTVHFCGSDAPMSKKELEGVGGDGEHRRDFRRVRAASCRRTTCRGVKVDAQVHRRIAGRHLPGQGEPMERSGDRQDQSRRPTARLGDHAGVADRRLGHDVHLHQLPGHAVGGLQVHDRHGQAGAVAVRPGRQGQRRRDGGRAADGRRIGLRRAELRRQQPFASAAW